MNNFIVICVLICFEFDLWNCKSYIIKVENLNPNNRRIKVKKFVCKIETKRMNLSYQTLRIFVRSFMKTIELLRGDNCDLVPESEGSFHLTFPSFELPDDKPINISVVFNDRKKCFFIG